MQKRILSIILSLAMMCTLLPTTAFASSDKGDIATDVVEGKIYFGNKADGTTPALYRVVAKDNDAITLFYHDANIANSTMQYDSLGHRIWSGSAICQWLNGEEFLDNTSVFTIAEKNAIVNYG